MISEILSIIGQVLTLIGALGLFLYGMKLMSEALQKVAGNKMRQILAAMTNSRFKGVLTGILVTTTIQSSSATTVMIVSFVNAGLLTLIASIGVIMGANIGTTITAWIIAILGFKISLSFLSLPLIGISFPLFFSKNSQRKSWGEFIIGFAILFIGLQFLKESVPDINSNPEALNFLASFTDLGFFSVIIFVTVGTILTIIIQSSSATMALTLVMTYNGLIPFELAAAMVLGENIGTTITANIAAVVANVSAKRTARAHFIFNIFGVIWMLATFHYFLVGIDMFIGEKNGVSLLQTNLSNTDFESVKGVYPIGLAIFHTSFNVINTLLLIGFAPLIAKVSTKMVPDKGEDDEEFKLKYINAGMFSTSELAIMQAQKEILNFGNRIQKMYSFIEILLEQDKPKKYYKFLSKIEKYEQITDNMEVEIADFLMRVSEGELSHEVSSKIRALLKIIDDMESVGDSIFQLSKVIDNLNQAKSHFSKDQLSSIKEISKLVEKAFEEMNKNLANDFKTVEIAKAKTIENKINKKRDDLRQKHVDDLKTKKYKPKLGSFYSDMFSMNEKIGDYIINVSEAIYECQETL